MQLETVVTKLIKFIKARSEALSISVTSGSIDSMEKYRYIIGQIAALEAVLQELSNLLEDKEQNGKGTPKLPKPTGWRMLVLPFKMKEKTKGGVILAEDTLERQQVASQVGLVMAMGPQCYKDKERYPEGPWCKEKDWVMFARYAGSRIKIEGGEMRLLNDDEVLATIDSPEDILHEF
jgi:chaperonin GroES